MKKNLQIFTAYKDKAIDLSRRNRLLKFPKSGRCLTFMHDLTSFVQTFGSLDEFEVPFIHKYIINPTPDIQNGPPLAAQTDCQGEHLITLLNKLRLEARRKFEEHGLHTLFLTIGKVRWKEPLSGTLHSSNVTDYDFDAPLLLIPARIEEKKNPKKTIITPCFDDNDISVNQVLSLKLEKEFGAHKLELIHDGDWVSTYFRLRKDITALFSESNINFEITDDIQVGLYTFVGQQIYRDLETHQDDMLTHEFINGLCNNEQLLQEGIIPQSDNPDHLLTADDDYNVMDADRSQLSVIERIIAGKHLTIQGPPGTGKSQTIVNSIANLLARKKTILVVCEKHVALRVVYDRLKECNLEPLCFPLFSHATDKKTFAKSIIDDRDTIIRLEEGKTSSVDDLALNHRSERIKELRDYAQALSTLAQPLGKSLYWVHGEWATYSGKTKKIPLTWQGSSLRTMTYNEYLNLIKHFATFEHVFMLPLNERHSHWKNIQKHHHTPAFSARIKETLLTLKNIFASLLTLPLIKPQSLSALKECINAEGILNHYRPFKKSLNGTQTLSYLENSLTTLMNLIEDYNDVFNDEKYLSPYAWMHTESPSELDSFNDRCTLSSLQQIIVDGTKLQSLLIHAEDSIHLFNERSLSLNEIIEYKDFLNINPLFTLIKNWHDKSTLKNVESKVTILLRLHEKNEFAKKIISPWLSIDDVDEEEALTIADRFSQGYGLFRFFSKQYRRDCYMIRSWCTEKTPSGHHEYSLLVSNLKKAISYTTKCNNLLNDLHELYLEEDISIENINSLLESVKSLSKVISRNTSCNSKEKSIPSSLSPILKDTFLMKHIRSFFALQEEVCMLFSTSWSNVKHPHVIQELLSNNNYNSLADMVQQVIEHAQASLHLNQALGRIRKENQNNATISILKREALEIALSHKKLCQLQEMHPEHIFDTIQIQELILNKHHLPEIIHTINLLSRVTKNPDTSLNDALAFIKALKEALPSLKKYYSDYQSTLQTLNALFENSQSFEHAEDEIFSDLIQRIEAMLLDDKGLEEWLLYRRLEYQTNELGHGWFINATQGMTPDPTSVFAQSLWCAWLEDYYAEHAILQNFNIKDHTQTIREFKALEKHVLRNNAQRILKKYAPDLLEAQKKGGKEEKELIRQSQLKIRHQPIRRVVTETRKQLLKYKPCWMMSPLTLSSYIPYGTLEFDAIIFDEASQLRVEHAIGAIARAKQVIIFGDENQLPPTSFFDSSSDADEEGIEEYESILNATKEILPGSNALLSHHYRSTFEELITFSNYYVYDNRLVTFPNPNSRHKAVVYEYVEEGSFDGGKGGSRRNESEAERIVALCVNHVQMHPEKSLGVIAFSKSQEAAIRDALHRYLKNDQTHHALLDETNDVPNSFFVKHLESVQGDERDVIILSIGYGPSSRTGEIHNRFGPINGPHGYRRLNVAITRAKEKVICVSSMKAGDMKNTASSRGARMLQKYLEYAQYGVQSLDASKLLQNQQQVGADSSFEVEVEHALTHRGFTVHRQIGASGFKIDLAIVNPQTNDEYILGIECDGASYHSSYSARMNDRIRQEILEKLGWKIYRIWSQHWVSHREEILDEICAHVIQYTTNSAHIPESIPLPPSL